MNYGKRSTTEHWKTVWGAAHSPWLSFFRISKLINYFENSDSFGLKQREKEKREISAHSFELCWPHYLELLPDGNGRLLQLVVLGSVFQKWFYSRLRQHSNLDINKLTSDHSFILSPQKFQLNEPTKMAIDGFCLPAKNLCC